MKKEVWKYYVGKKVFIILNEGRDTRKYQGTVIEIQENGKTFMCINDKFNRRVCFSVDKIETIQEEFS